MQLLLSQLKAIDFGGTKKSIRAYSVTHNLHLLAKLFPSNGQPA